MRLAGQPVRPRFTGECAWPVHKAWRRLASTAATTNSADDRPTVIVNGCDTGVENRLGQYVVFPTKKFLFPSVPASAFGAIAGGCYIADLLAACTWPFVDPNHGQYQSRIVQLTKDLRTEGVISASEGEAIRSCAAEPR